MLWGFPSRSHPFHYVTDRRGFRNEKDRTGADIYLLGDSILVAAALPFGETVCGRLESSTGLEVVNIALIGISLQEARDLLMKSKVPIENRLVLQCVFEGNDLLDSATYRREGEGSVETQSRSLIEHLVVALQRMTDSRKLRASRLIATYDGNDALFLWDRRSFAGLEAEWKPVTDTLAEVRQYVEQKGGTYAIVFVPSKIRVLGRFCTWPANSTAYESHIGPMRDWLLEWCAETRTPLVDATPAMVEVAKGGRSPWFLGDTHPNGDGHAAMTTVILESEILGDWRNRTGR